jgi:energy-coupling factor transport system permease protein
MFTATAFTYRRLSSPLHAARATVGAAWALALTAATLVLFHPLVLLALMLAVLGAGAAAGVGHQLRRALRTAAIVAIPIVVINVLVSRDGLTVFARLGDLGPFGQGDLTVQALVYGVLIALKVTLLILISTLASLAIDPEDLLHGLRRLSFRSALTASLSMRMIPLLAADSQRMAEAQRTRPGGAPTGTRARVGLLGAVIGGSLDRAMDIAATLELRGFAAAARPQRRLLVSGLSGSPQAQSSRLAGLGRSPISRSTSGPAHLWSRHDIAFACSAVAIIAIAVLGRLGGMASLQVYPLIHMPVTAGTFVMCAALIAAILLPFVDRRGIDP